MFQDKQVVVVTPAGRRRYLDLLVPQVLALRPIVDEYRLWINTENEEDIAYMRELAHNHEFIKLEYLPPGTKFNNNLSIHHFFKNAIDPNTVYVRFDDDVIYLDTVEAFKAFLHFRITHPEYFLVYGNILNNAVLTHIHQRYGNFSYKPIVHYDCMDRIGWADPQFAEELHMQIIDVLHNDTEQLATFHMPNWILHFYERVSINCISWLGSEFASFEGDVGEDEEKWLSVDKPKQLQKPNIIYGGFCCVHYGFYTQREHLDKTDILNHYSLLLTG